MTTGGTSKHATRVMKIAVGGNNRGKVKNTHLTWDQFQKRIREPVRTKESFKKYLKLTADEQGPLKNSAGYWIGGHCEDGKRKRDAIHERDSITFDIDSAPADITDRLELGLTGVSGYEFAVHSSRKHSPSKPRLRVIFPLKKAIPADQYTAAARILASILDPTMNTVDPVSFRIAQMMYWPSCSADSEYVYFRNDGELVDVAKLLSDFGDWQDFTKLPFGESEKSTRQSAKKAEHPHEKRGIVGAFCRAYSIEDAIEKFIPDIYTPGDEHSGKPRYTYTGGSASNGAVVEDDGLFLYSHHGTDPCGDRLVNAFDLVRIHLFGDQDTKADEDEGPTKLPSYREFVEYLKDDAPTVAQLAADRYDMDAMFDDSDLTADEGTAPSSLPYEKPAKNGHILEAAGADEDTDRDDEITALLGKPSRIEFDPDIEALLGSGSPAGSSIDDLGPAPKPKTWFPSQLELTEEGGIRATLANVATIVQNDARLWGVIARNEFTGQIVARRSLNSKMPIVPPVKVPDVTNGVLWDDIFDASVRAIMESPSGKGKAGYGLKVSDRDLREAIILTAQKRKFHPVREYMSRLKWDGVKRLDSLLVRYLGCPDTAYHRDVIRLVLTAAVTRTFEPGHKFDSAMILEGTQGLGKSTFIKILARYEWFSELRGDMGDVQKMVEQMAGFLILELPELAGLRKSEVDDTKAFLSSTEDTVRLAYDKRATTMRRQCVFIGSTNDSKYLKDQTGNRRFWPIKVATDRIDIQALDAEMDQVWAEAVTVYRDMRAAQPKGTLPLYLASREAQDEAFAIQESRRVENAEEGMGGTVSEWLDKAVPLSTLLSDMEEKFNDSADVMVQRTVTCQKQIFLECLGGTELSYANPSAPQTLGRAMRYLTGWAQPESQRRLPMPYGKQRVYVRMDATPEEITRGYRIVTDDDGQGLL
jgi:putative DNA primase/helicase